MSEETIARRVRVFVNDREGVFHLGLQVKHAIGSRWARAVRERRAVVRDAEGNRYGLDGALYDGQRLYVETINPDQV
ncbi:MAG: hypothetical protein HYR71_05740 [Chloroflexi bacterium]|nr:hypothetical protein [Chloroflexota bacterium]